MLSSANASGGIEHVFMVYYVQSSIFTTVNLSNCEAVYNLSILIFGYCQSSSFVYYAPAIFNGGHIVSPLSVHTSVLSVPYVTLLVSVRYLLKGLVYWIEILYTGI